MPEFDALDFGEKVRALRGNRNQNDVATNAGIPQYTWSNIEHGKTQKPAFQDIIGVGKALNLSPNEIAALAGMWVIDESEADVFSFRVRNALDRVRTLLLDLDEHAQDEIASIMLGIVAAEVDRRKTLENHEVDNAILPAWLRGRR